MRDLLLFFYGFLFDFAEFHLEVGLRRVQSAFKLDAFLHAGTYFLFTNYLGALVLCFNLSDVGVLDILFDDFLDLFGLAEVLLPDRNHLMGKLLLPNLCLLSLVPSIGLPFTELLSFLLTMSELFNKVLLVLPLDALHFLCSFARLLNLFAYSLLLQLE